MIRIADFDSKGMPYLFVGSQEGGRFIFQHKCAESLLASWVAKPFEEVIELEGIYAAIFAGASIIDAESAGKGGFELTVQM